MFTIGSRLMDNEPVPASPIEDIPTHPEEMKAAYNLRVGKSISLQASARLTPAGVITLGIAACSVILVAAFATKYVGRSRQR